MINGRYTDNFEMFLTTDKGIVPGSRRVGHNVLTNTGRYWLAQLVAWAVVRDVDTEPSVDDTPYNISRVKWFGVGTGFYSESRNIESLQTPAAVNATPDYLKAASVAPAYPDASRAVPSAVRFTCQFDTAELPGDPYISEAGLFVDANDTAGVYGLAQTGIDITDSDHSPIAYKSFDPPLQKITVTNNLIVRWELRFR